jgi:hypothetical protein
MGDADGTGEASMGMNRILEHSNSTDALHLIDRASIGVLEDGDPGRVVASIFEPLEPLKKNGGGVSTADIGDNSTHVRRSPDLCRTRKRAKDRTFLLYPAAHAID